MDSDLTSATVRSAVGVLARRPYIRADSTSTHPTSTRIDFMISQPDRLLSLDLLPNLRLTTALGAPQGLGPVTVL